MMSNDKRMSTMVSRVSKTSEKKAAVNDIGGDIPEAKSMGKTLNEQGEQYLRNELQATTGEWGANLVISSTPQGNYA